MCIGNNKYKAPQIDFNDTILLGLEVLNPTNHRVEHVLGYYNTVSARSVAAPTSSKDLGWERKHGAAAGGFGWKVPRPIMSFGNAMLFAVPAKPGTLNRDSLIPVSKFPHFMQDYKTAVSPTPPQMRSYTLSISKSVDPEPIVVKGFDGGTYDVVIAQKAGDIPLVISKVDEAKRPQINADLYAKLNLLYPDFTFVLFCFSEEDKAKSGCQLMKYEPHPELDHLLYLPGVDGHNGEVENGDVTLNHTLVVGSYLMDKIAASRVLFTDPGLKATYPFLLDRVIGKVIPAGTKARQGDFLFLLDDVRKGDFRAKRELPPGWEQVFGTGYRSDLPELIEIEASDLGF